VGQAQKAIELYRFLQSMNNTQYPKEGSKTFSDAWKKAADNMVKRLRLKQRSYRTEQNILSIRDKGTRIDARSWPKASLHL
jgi:hypothetical protein